MLNHLLERLRKPLDDSLQKHLIPTVTPILSFGNILNSKVATVSINPSSDEWPQFQNRASFGFKSLFELNLSKLEDLATCDDSVLLEIVSGCNSYFNDDNYLSKWFDPIKKALEGGLGTSYVNSDQFSLASHIDLSPWTTTRWSALPADIQSGFLSENTNFYLSLMQLSNIETIIFLGSTTWNYTKNLKSDGKRVVRISELHSQRLFESQHPNWSGLPEVGTGQIEIEDRVLRYFRISQSPSDSRTISRSTNRNESNRFSVPEKYEAFMKYMADQNTI